MNTEQGQALWAKAKNIIPGGCQLLSKNPEQFLPVPGLLISVRTGG